MAQTLPAGTGTRPGADALPVNPRKRGKRAPVLVDLYRSAVGKKWVMAITGVGLMGFVFAHLVGNLKFWMGVEASGEHAGEYAIDVYGEALRNLLYPILPHSAALWLFRLGLIAMFGLHIHAAYSLTAMNRRSRPVKYQSSRDYVAVTFASRTMRWSGIIVGLYVLFHLADLTWGWANPAFEHGEVHHNMVASLTRLPVAGLYLLASLALAVHLYHGAWSLFQSLGLNNPRYNAARRSFAVGFAVLMGVGNALFPILIYAGVGH